ncbi:hypothetical protein MLD38_038892 [Melastoma candidum]|uniref:Uncharacterized protein n=1 Tax=Melastoma candidum TaxID=119954 RepID=A0ACB9L2N5_9MYRT|nr:hypothetical protein MLD38_038892 [Melastoma candidum]
MATAWVKSLQCKSRALEDVRCHWTKHSSPSSGGSCRHTARSVRDILDVSRHGKPKPKNPKQPRRECPDSDTCERGSGGLSSRHVVPESLASYPALTELHQGHPSRNVVEIIFHTGWGSRPFPGRVERIFKVQNKPGTVSRFEEYRGSVQFRAGPRQSPSRSVHSGGGGVVPGGRSGDNARCLADGNEVMGFQCVGGAGGSGAVCDVTAFGGAMETKGRFVAVRTFSGSGLAHENGGGGKGRRAMLVCRVIAGRVLEKGGIDPFSDTPAACDSVSRRKGELVVLDSRAVLPCFLIIYRL